MLLFNWIGRKKASLTITTTVMSRVLAFRGKTYVCMCDTSLVSERPSLVSVTLPFHLVFFFFFFLQSFHSYPCRSTPHLGGEQPGRNNVSSCFSRCGGTLASSFAKIRPSRFPAQIQPCGRLNSRVQARADREPNTDGVIFTQILHCAVRLLCQIDTINKKSDLLQVFI